MLIEKASTCKQASRFSFTILNTKQNVFEVTFSTTDAFVLCLHTKSEKELAIDFYCGLKCNARGFEQEVVRKKRVDSS